MAPRNGAQVLQKLKDEPAEIWYCGERVEDVTTHPAFKNGVHSLARLYDLQREKADEMLYTEEDGSQAGLSYKVARSVEDLQRIGRMMKHWADASFGMMGRAPDYLNRAMVGYAGGADFLGEDDPRFSDNARNYLKHIRQNDLCMTHTLISPQANRAVGMADWDRTGPRYVVGDDGAAVRAGRFDDEVWPVAAFVWAQLHKSLIVQRVSQRRREVSAEDLERFHAIVDTARLVLERRYPSVEFHAILWDQEGEPPPDFCEGLEARGVTVHRMSRILPNRVIGDPRFEVSPLDRHPNGRLYDAIARYVARRILPGPDL